MSAQPASRNVWQVSAGTSNRTYADVFLKYGVALIGPGDTGPWRAGRDDEEFEGSYVRRFATEVHIGDIILLRAGLSTIRAVGLVATEYLYLPQFDDVNGWDLSHARRVRWCQLPDEYNFGSPVFGANPPRLSKVNTRDVVGYAERFTQSPPTHWQTSTLPPLPELEPPLGDVPVALQGLVAQVHDLTNLYWDRQAFGEHPTEDELVVHYVVPLLRALGWPAEKIAVKWRYIDVSVFESLPRSAENCRFIIEAKRLGQGIEGALEQAKTYIKALGVPRDIVVTDGIRYRLYGASNDYAPAAYANLAYLKHSALDLFERIRRPTGGI